MDELIAKVESFSLASRGIHLGLLSVSSAAVGEHLALEREYMRLLAESGPEQAEDGELDDIALRIASSARETCRALTHDHQGLEALYEAVEGEPGFDPRDPRRSVAAYIARNTTEEDEGLALAEFVRSLQAIRDITFKKLLTTAEEERSRWEFIEEVMAKERVATSAVNRLQQELATETKAREKDITARQDTIKKLEFDLLEVNMLNSDRQKSSEKQSRDRELSEGQHFQTKEGVLKDQIDKLKAELEETLTANRENEDQLRKKKLKNEKRVEEIIQAYDTDMEEKHTELEELKDAYAREKRFLAELVDHEAALAVRNEEIESALAKAKLAEEHRAKEWKKIHLAAAKIQAVYRGFRVRKVARERLRKKKKKGKKGKGKGKKK